MLTRLDNFDLSDHNTFALKVSCAVYLEYESLEELSRIDFSALPQPVLHIGAGSNLLFTGDFPGTVLHSAIKYIRPLKSDGHRMLVETGAGTLFDEMVAWSCGRGLWGAENLSAIPGETGAAAVQNVGAYGVEAKDIIERVDCFDTATRTPVSFGAEACSYGYRDSMFKRPDNRGRYVVTGVTFRLGTIPAPKLDYGGVRAALGDRLPSSPSVIREVVCGIRAAKLPDPSVTGSAGSFFKNPVLSPGQFEEIAARYGDVPHYPCEGGVKVPAAWMIEQCGLKGETLGGAAVYERQPLVLVNLTGKATASDIISLEKKITDRVKERFGVVLHPEVEHV